MTYLRDGRALHLYRQCLRQTPLQLRAFEIGRHKPIATGYQALMNLRRIQRQTAAANPYLPVWLVAPRAWAQRNVSQPRFDGSGRLLLQELNKP